MRFTLTMKGLTPLLMHADDVEWSDRMEIDRGEINKVKEKGKSKGKKGDDRSPAWSWIGYLYRTPEGVVSLPVENIRKCLMQAGKMVGKPKGGNTNYQREVATGVWIEGAYGPVLIGGKPVNAEATLVKLDREPDYQRHTAEVAKLGFRLWAKRAPLKGGGKHVRIRPRFEAGWGATFTGSLDPEIIDKDTFAQVVELAGSRIGVGDWRPSSPTPGTYGMFDTELKFGK
jgi:hypothetical protein